MSVFSLSLSFWSLLLFLKLSKEDERKKGEVQWEANLRSAMKDYLLHPQGRNLALPMQEAIEGCLLNSWVSFLHFWLFTKEFGLCVWRTLCPRGHRSQLFSVFGFAKTPRSSYLALRRLIAFDENDICDNRGKITCQLKVAPQSLFIKLLGLLRLLLPAVAQSHPGTDIWFPIFGKKGKEEACFFWWDDIKISVPSVRSSNQYCFWCLDTHSAFTQVAIVSSITSMKIRGVVKPVLDFQLQDKVGLAPATFAVFPAVVSGMGTREVGWLRCMRLLREQSHLPMLFCFLFASEPVLLLSHVWHFVTPWTAAHQAPLSSAVSQSLLKFMSIELVMPSNHLILCYSLLFLPSIFPSIRVFSNELMLCIRWPKYWSFKGWFPLGWTGWICLQSKGLSRVFSNTTVQKHWFFGARLSL